MASASRLSGLDCGSASATRQITRPWQWETGHDGRMADLELLFLTVCGGVLCRLEVRPFGYAPSWKNSSLSVPEPFSRQERLSSTANLKGQ